MRINSSGSGRHHHHHYNNKKTGGEYRSNLHPRQRPRERHYGHCETAAGETKWEEGRGARFKAVGKG